MVVVFGLPPDRPADRMLRVDAPGSTWDAAGGLGPGRGATTVQIAHSAKRVLFAECASEQGVITCEYRNGRERFSEGLLPLVTRLLGLPLVVRVTHMSLKPAPIPPVPEETARVARTASHRGDLTCGREMNSGSYTRIQISLLSFPCAENHSRTLRTALDRAGLASTDYWSAMPSGARPHAGLDHARRRPAAGKENSSKGRARGSEA